MLPCEGMVIPSQDYYACLRTSSTDLFDYKMVNYCEVFSQWNERIICA